MVKTSVFDCIKGYAESLYASTCTVIEYIGGEGVINNAQPVTAAEGIPCRLSFKSAPAAGNGAALKGSLRPRASLWPMYRTRKWNCSRKGDMLSGQRYKGGYAAA